MKSLICNALKREITNDIGSVRFPNPRNPSEMIVRSSQARKIVAPFVATNFKGPN